MKEDPLAGKKLTYVLITPARNEEAYIGKTIQSMIAQTVLPIRWVVISDGSTDGTDGIVQSYSNQVPWIDFVRMPEHPDRSFAHKAHTFNAGYRRVEHLDFDVVGNLDADVSFDEGMMEYLLNQFACSPDLGVAGPSFYEEPMGQYDYRYANIEHVPGMCQLFRRQCFEEIGGYTPIQGGGIDWVAVTTARMKGWKTKTFREKRLLHHRRMGTGSGNVLCARWRLGREDYYLGSHPLWEFLRACYHVKDKPYLIGGVLLFMGYAAALVAGMERPIPEDLMEFCRKEQLERLLRFTPWHR